MTQTDLLQIIVAVLNMGACLYYMGATWHTSRRLRRLETQLFLLGGKDQGAE